MKKINKKDLCEALLCVEMMEIRKIDENPSVQWKKSANYIDAIEKLLADVRARNNAPSFTFKKAIAAVLIAALLLAATACAVIKPIREFFVEVFDEYINLTPNVSDKEEFPKTIETVYTIATVPDEFMLIDASRTNLGTQFFWMSDTEMIILEQGIAESTNITIDGTNSVFEELTIGDRKIYKTSAGGLVTIDWAEHGYLFSISCSDTIPWETIVNMIADLAPEENASA